MSTKVDKVKQSNTRKCPLKWTSNNRVSTKVDSYHIIKYVFVPCPSRSSSIRLNDYSARAQNMCNAHIFKLLIMFRTRNMCSAHIFKVAYMCLLALIICGAFFTDAYSFPNRWVCVRFPCTAAQNSSIMEFAVAQFLNKAKQNHAFASVTYKTCRASFPNE